MTRLFLQDKICIPISGALMMMMMMQSKAQLNFFPQPENLSWDMARNHCQVCFRDLVTLTPDNSHLVAQNITSDSWIGLRKHLNSSSLPWSCWANGDPLTFQNWYPGWPVIKSPFPEMNCSCTCPAVMTQTLFEYGNLSTANASEPTTLECDGSSVLIPNDPDDEEIEEESCVAVLTFGPWIEKNCSELLPFICYEDRFSGPVNVADVRNSSATLSWPPGPGNISHYRVEVRGEQLTEIPPMTVTGVTSNLSSLTAGTRYFIQVFPVKCERDLNPQDASFYTKVNKVQNLTVTEVTETSVFLSWKKPPGNVDFYLVEAAGVESSSDTEGSEVRDLMPGSGYTFTVFSGLNNSMRSEGSPIATFTMPGKVYNLEVSENKNTSLLLRWILPEGNVTAFRVRARNDKNDKQIDKVVQCNCTQTWQEERVTGLPTGTRITLSVAALANGTTEGENETVVGYTAPGQISNLTLETTSHSLHANWTPPDGNFSTFHVTLQLAGQEVKIAPGLTEPVMTFDQLKTAAKYTVIVRSVFEGLQSPPVEESKFTSPLPPTHAIADLINKSQITFMWRAPENAHAPRYLAQVSSSFWGQQQSIMLFNQTTHTFKNLSSGTKYDFQVQTVTDDGKSEPLTLSPSPFTVAEKIEVSMSMMCSSAQPLLCADSATEESVFARMKAHYENLLGDHVFWRLEKQEN